MGAALQSTGLDSERLRKTANCLVRELARPFLSRKEGKKEEKKKKKCDILHSKVALIVHEK